MAARSKARKRALDILFEAEMQREPLLTVLEVRTARADPPVVPYARELVQGVQAHQERIDDLLAEHARGWTLDRMPAVDRNILRIGAYELLWRDDVPDAVAISEAVVLATDLSTDASPGFVNGLLARLLELKPELVADEPVGSDPVGSDPGDSEPGSSEPGSSEPGSSEPVGSDAAGDRGCQ